ncbi:response regulator [Bowmanella denitrificans]|uniref:histidine kinase n=1 Tax=Bowmanella denitrificans TaxID=366582 RepID=A0ABN0XMY4_9ALTE
MRLHSLSQKIALGYLLLVALLAAAVLLTIVEIQGLSRETERLIDLREPTAKLGLELDSGINHSLSALRGWIVTGDDEYRLNRRRVWAEQVETALQNLDKLSSQWKTENVLRFSKLTPIIGELQLQMEQVEALAGSDPAAANASLENNVMPLVLAGRDVLNNMLDDQRNAFRSELLQVSERISFLSMLEWSLMVMGLVLGGLLSWLVTKAVTGPVADAVAVADNIGRGNLDTDIVVGGSKELDVLGTALLNMREALKDKTSQNERFNWMSTGQNRLNEAMRGDKQVELLSSSIISFLASYINACIGALYLLDERQNRLVLQGSYAHGGGSAPEEFHLGEGLVGQVAVSGTPLLISEVDEDYIRVRSSIVDGVPRQLYLCPFQFEGKSLGVLELGKMQLFSGDEMEFVRANMEAVAISLNSALSRKKIQMLLEETQQQSEELQQQQEELEQSNEELEEQTQQLKEQQEELQAANEELEEQTQLIMQKNQDLEKAQESIEIKARQLEISSKYKSEFLANMSHELRTPLNSLLILAQDLANNNQGNLDDEQVESAQVISKSGHDLLHLINDILDLSKVEAGKLDLNVSQVSLQQLADDIMRQFRRTATDKGLVFTVSLPSDLPLHIQTDRNRLMQVLNNLISNALKFTEQGKVQVDWQMKDNKWLVIRVTDTGIGIAEDKQDVIFEAFVQAEGGTSRKYGGTGLGLSICRELCKLLGGSLSVDSELGRGSVFTLSIPLILSSQAVPVHTPKLRDTVLNEGEERFLDYPCIADQRENVQDGDRVLLIIEDDRSFSEILAAQARNKGFKHLNTATGEDGLVLARRYLPHAIILDLDLPGMDGHMVLKQLKADPETRHIPVHIMSAHERSLDPIRSGALDYLTKPVSKDELEMAFTRMEDFINRKMKNLLVVEDDDNLRKAIVKLIGNGDVQCFEAGTAQRALELCRTEQVDCMVLDVGLPDLSGFEMLRQLKSEHQEQLPPVIVYTGRELNRQENDELQQYAETIIVKGVKSEERLLDETALFLHRAITKLPAAKKELITQLYDGESQLQGKCVLLVDDDMRNVFALSKVLKDKGMEVVKAENGRVALSQLEASKAVDFVLMDIMMPEMDGYECMRHIRAKSEFRDLPIVALTAKAMKEDRQKCLEAGANDYIAKPVNVERLISLMKIWVNR